MIKSISIKNFQNHENTKIALGKITSIIGKTNAGKSSILRGFRWLCLNKPSGEAFIRQGQSRVRVRVRCDGRKIGRTKTAGGNLYKLDGKTFTAFGSDVPEEIANHLNVDENNFQKQLDGPYWLQLSSGQVSKELNKIVNLELIDKVLGNIASELRKSRLAVEVSQQRLDEATKEKERLEWVLQAESDLAELRIQQIQIDEKKSKYNQLRTFDFSLLSANAEVSRLAWVEEATNQLMGLISQNNVLLTKQFKKDSFRCVAGAIDTYNLIINREQATRKIADKTIKKGTKILELQEKVDSLRSYDSRISIAKEEERKWNQMYTMIQQKFREKFKEQQVCPYCGGKLSLQAVECTDISGQTLIST